MINLLRFVLLIFSFIASTAYTSGQPIEPTFEEVLEEAISGDFDSQYLLGDMYYTGDDDVEINYAEALKWYLCALQHFIDEQEKNDIEEKIFSIYKIINNYRFEN